MYVIWVRWRLLPYLTSFQQRCSCDGLAFFYIMIGRNVSNSSWRNEMKSHDGKGNCGAQIKETLSGRAGCCHSSARLRARARSRQALASTPIYYSGALPVSPQPKCPWQKQKSPRRLRLRLLLRFTSRSLFCFILRSVLWCFSHI